MQEEYEPTWRYLAVVSCLLILCITGPRLWKEFNPPAEEDLIKVMVCHDSATEEIGSDASAVSPATHVEEAAADDAPTPRAELVEMAPPAVPARTEPAVGDLFDPDAAVAPEDADTVDESANDETVEYGALPLLPADDPSRSVAGSRPQAGGPVELQITDDSTADDPVTHTISDEAGDSVDDVAVDRLPALEPAGPSAGVGVVPQPSMLQPWPRPAVLLERLDRLAQYDFCRQWALESVAQVERLHQIPSLDSREAEATLDRLRALVDRGERLALSQEYSSQRSELLRAGYGMARRVDVWQQVRQVASLKPSSHPFDRAELVEAIDRARTFFQGHNHESAWQDYLALKDLRVAAAAEGMDESRRELAYTVLRRIESTALTDGQQRIVRNREIRELHRCLRHWVYLPVDGAELLAVLEDLELSSDALDARKLARQWQALRFAPQREAVELARRIDVHYRNANIRVAVAEDLINQLMPERADEEGEVSDQILGTPVYGQQRTSTQVSVRLRPDPHRWRFDIVARGNVDADTAANHRGITFFSRGNSRFLARKPLAIDRRGVQMSAALARAETETDLIDIDTNYDGMPLFGGMVRNIARNQHNARQWDAEAEVEDRVSFEARQRLDEEVDVQLASLEQEFQDKILKPLKRLRLDPTPTDMYTTQERLIVRYRMAGGDQLAARTPRPIAPAGSLLSTQVNESAINNLIEQLDLDGREGTVQELFDHIGQALGMELTAPDDTPEDAVIRFADEGAVRVKFEDGVVRLEVGIAKLSRGRRSWTDFTVIANYRPEVEGLDAYFIRDGVVQLGGRRLGFRDQVAMRGVFSKILARNTKLHVLPSDLVRNPRMQEMVVSQFVIRDAWFGLAIGPGHVRSADRVADQPAEETVRR
jgi:hypothetical protein